MSHFAKVVDGVVTEVISADQSFIDSQEGTWIQTSYNTWGNAHKLGGTPLRGNYAGIGYTYDAVNNVFVAPQTYSSWVLNQSTWLWEAPTPSPQDDKSYFWDEPTTSWKELA
jgi:hypothetical protein